MTQPLPTLSKATPPSSRRKPQLKPRVSTAYTKVTSPISGRIGKSAVTEGALVQNGQSTALATVQQLDPIYVDVTQSSNDFLRLKQELANGKLKQENGKAKVELVTNDGLKYPQEGTLEFSDVTVDQTTGSITLRAIFPNPDHTLLPGCLFAHVWKKVLTRMRCWFRNRALPVPARRCQRDGGRRRRQS